MTNPQKPIIHYVCTECEEKGLIIPPCIHFKEQCYLMDHTVVWAGDGYYCSECMQRFSPDREIIAETWGEELEDLINEIRSNPSTDSVAIHEFVRVLLLNNNK